MLPILFPGKKRISDKHPKFQERKNVRLFGVMTKTSVSSDKNIPLQEENTNDILEEKNLENPIESYKSTFQDKTFQKLHTKKVHRRVKPLEVKIQQPKILKICKICETTYFISS